MSITPEDLAAIQRRQKIAEALMQQGQEPLETNQVAGGYVVPVSPLAGLSKIIQSMSGAYMGKKADERKAAMEREQQAAVTGIDFNSPDAPQKLIAAGRFEDGLKLAIDQQREAKKVHREGIPSGFDKTEGGSIKPMPVEGYGDYANFLLQQAGAKKQQLGPFDEEKMDMSRDDQAMQHQALALSQANADRAAAQAEQSNRIAREKFDYEKGKDTTAKEKPIYDATSDEWVYPPSEGFPEGKRTVSSSRTNAVKSLNYGASRLIGTKEAPGLIYKVKTGGPLGFTGKISTLTDSQKTKEFSNIREQLSTDLRSIFRIPGEGTLSDKEQNLYGIQLPSIEYDQDVNERIIKDIKTRAAIRLETPQSRINNNKDSNTEYTTFKLSGKAMAMPEDKRALVQRVLESGSDEEKVKLLNKGWLEEQQ